MFVCVIMLLVVECEIFDCACIICNCIHIMNIYSTCPFRLNIMILLLIMYSAMSSQLFYRVFPYSNIALYKSPYVYIVSCT